MSLDSIDEIDSRVVDEWDLDCEENIEVISEEEARMYNDDRMYNGISLNEAIDDIYLDIQDGFILLEDNCAIRISTINKIFLSSDSRLDRGHIVISIDGLAKHILKYKNPRKINGPQSSTTTYNQKIIKKVLSLLHEKKQGVLNVV